MKTISQQLEEVVNEICNHYCKYPDIWDEEKEGCELSESEVCANCPSQVTMTLDEREMKDLLDILGEFRAVLVEGESE